MSSPRICPSCGTEVAAGSPAGLCPRCLFRAGFEEESVGADVSAPQVDSSFLPTVRSPAATGFVPPTPQELARWFPQLEVLELLGKGGMGAVYKARQPGLDRLVAIKILPSEVSHDPGFNERFQREARALARLSHPNIVGIYDFGQTDGLCWFLMEYVDGTNLRQTIEAKSLSPQQALQVVPQICDALQYAHDEGIVHRDIKPENILLDRRGRVKIADFGLAKLVGPELTDHSLTATHQVMGTLRYMAPEQMEGSKQVDHRADIFSLGVVFYELLTGQLPLGRFAPPSKIVQIDVRLDEVVLRTLEKEPEQRFQHASDVKTEVEAIRGSEPITPSIAPTAPHRDDLVHLVVTLWPDKIAAIRAFRSATGAGLMEAKRAVETIAALRGLRDVPQSQRQRAWTITVLCAATAFGAWWLGNSSYSTTVKTLLTVGMSLSTLGMLVVMLITWRRMDRPTRIDGATHPTGGGGAPMDEVMARAVGRWILLAVSITAAGVFLWTSIEGKTDERGSHLLIRIGAFDPWYTYDRLQGTPPTAEADLRRWANFSSERKFHWLSWSMLAAVVSWASGAAFKRITWGSDSSRIAEWWRSLPESVRNPAKTVLTLFTVAVLIWILSFHAKGSMTPEGTVHNVEMGAVDPWFQHKSHPNGFTTSLNFTSISSFLGYLAAIAVWLLVAIGRAERPAAPAETAPLAVAPHRSRRRAVVLAVAVALTIVLLGFLLWCVKEVVYFASGRERPLLELGETYSLGRTPDDILWRLVLIGGPLLLFTLVAWIATLTRGTRDRREIQAERRIAAPAICGIISSAIGMLIWMGATTMTSVQGAAIPFFPMMLAITAFTLSCVSLAGYIAMLQVRNRGLATAGAIISLIPTHLGWLLGLPAGIWSLRVLARDDVREVFRRRQEELEGHDSDA